MHKICVIGGANIDICGASIDPLRNFDSNPGQISVAFGGVGRNIAQICTLLKQDVRFVTVFSGDNYGQLMKADCEKLGMDCSDSMIVDDYPSSMYIAILDSDRDMKLGMSDMRILSRMTPEMLEKALKNLDAEDMIILDANIDMECLHYIVENAPCPIAADPVSANKAVRLKELLHGIAVFKPNQYEAEELTGILPVDEESARRNIDWFLEHGVKEILISMADRGILLGTKDEKVWLTHRRIDLENATGGGDSLLGAYVSQRLIGKSPMESIRYGISCAVTEIEQDSVRRRSLDPDEVSEKIETMNIKEKKL